MSASSGFRFGLPKLSTGRTVLNCGTKFSVVSAFGCDCSSTGPRNVLLAEPRSASQSVACQRSASFGFDVEPVLPP